MRVFSDRVEVVNPGELPPGKTVAWLFDEHESMPFNPLIAAAFYQARYIEHVGSGIEDVEAACAEAGLPQTTVDVRNRTIVQTIWRKTTKETVKTSKKTTKETKATTKETVGTTKDHQKRPLGVRSEAQRKAGNQMKLRLFTSADVAMARQSAR